MMRLLALFGILLLAAAQPVVAVQPSPVADTDEATYKAFFTADHDERIRVFNELPPEKKASLVRTHLRRWLLANQADLTDEQSEVLNEALGLISPEMYVKPAPPDLTDRVAALGKRAEALLGEARAAQALRISGAYVPASKQ